MSVALHSPGRHADDGRRPTLITSAPAVTDANGRGRMTRPRPSSAARARLLSAGRPLASLAGARRLVPGAELLLAVQVDQPALDLVGLLRGVPLHELARFDDVGVLQAVHVEA